MHESYDRGGVRWVGGDVLPPLPPTPDEWAAEWEREHPGEPGPVAFWTDGTVGWSVTPPTPNTVPRVITVRIVIGDIVATLMDVVGGVPQWHVRSGFGTKDDILLLGRLMEAAEHPIGTPAKVAAKAMRSATVVMP